MFARIVKVNLKPNRSTDFTETLDKQVIPMLRARKGFQDEITFCAPSGTEVVSISLWDKKENAESYNTETYPEVLKAFMNFLDGSPQVKTYEIINSTYHKIAAPVAV